MFEKKETERELSLTEKDEIWCPGWFFMQHPTKIESEVLLHGISKASSPGSSLGRREG